MARYSSRVDVWTLDESARAKLQPGQHVTAGQGGPLGRYMGQSRHGTDVVAWRENGRRAPLSYLRAIRAYAVSIR